MSDWTVLNGLPMYGISEYQGHVDADSPGGTFASFRVISANACQAKCTQIGPFGKNGQKCVGKWHLNADKAFTELSSM